MLHRTDSARKVECAVSGGVTPTLTRNTYEEVIYNENRSHASELLFRVYSCACELKDSLGSLGTFQRSGSVAKFLYGRCTS